jgi:hypothetical protein
LRAFTLERMLSTFGLAKGQALLIRGLLDDSGLNLTFPSANARDAPFLPRSTAQSALVHPIPAPFVLLSNPAQVPLAAPAASPSQALCVAPVQQPLFEAPVQPKPRGLTGQFLKKRKQ